MACAVDSKSIWSCYTIIKERVQHEKIQKKWVSPILAHPVELYVDDGLIIAEKEKTIDTVLNTLKSEFDVNVIESKKFPGLQYNIYDSGIGIYQSAYINEIIHRFGLSKSKPASVPMNHGFSNRHSKALKPNVSYREAVGALLYKGFYETRHIIIVGQWL